MKLAVATRKGEKNTLIVAKYKQEALNGACYAYPETAFDLTSKEIFDFVKSKVPMINEGYWMVFDLND